MQFQDDLLQAINALDTTVKATNGFLLPTDQNAALTSLPGGKRSFQDMAGNKELTLNFDYLIRSNDQRLVNSELWLVSDYLGTLQEPEDFEQAHDDYGFKELTITSVPSMSDVDERGSYVGVIEFQVVVEDYDN
jgi:hypothetical protein